MTVLSLVQSASTPCEPCGGGGTPCEYPTMELWIGYVYNGEQMTGDPCALNPFSGETWTGQTFTPNVMFETIRPCLQWEPEVAYDMVLTVAFSGDGYDVSCELHIWQNVGESVMRHEATYTASVPSLDSDPCVLGVGGTASVASDWDETGPVRVRAVLSVNYGGGWGGVSDCVLATCEGEEGPFDIGSRWNGVTFFLSVEAEYP